MKIFALGGYGKVGLAAIELLSRSDSVTVIAIAGRNLERAEKAALKIGEKAIAIQADAVDEQKLTSLLADYDIIMNAAYDDLVLPSIRAAINAKTHYCDANVILEPALQLSTEATSADITAIVANGVSPNISNLMGVYVANQLEEVEQLQLGRADVYNFQTGLELTPLQWHEEPQESLTTLREFRQFITWVLDVIQTNGIRTVRSQHDGRWDSAAKVWTIPTASREAATEALKTAGAGGYRLERWQIDVIAGQAIRGFATWLQQLEYLVRQPERQLREEHNQ